MRIFIFIASVFISSNLLADTIRVDIKALNDKGVEEQLGFIDLIETPRGVAFAFDTKLPAGEHGYNIHNTNSCNTLSDAALNITTTENSDTQNESSDESNQASENGVVTCRDMVSYVGSIATIMNDKPNNAGLFPDVLVGSNKYNKQIFVIESIKSLKPLLNKLLVIRVGNSDSALKDVTKFGSTKILAWGVISDKGIIPSSPEDEIILKPIKDQYMIDLVNMNKAPQVKNSDASAVSNTNNTASNNTTNANQNNNATNSNSAMGNNVAAGDQGVAVQNNSNGASNSN